MLEKLFRCLYVDICVGFIKETAFGSEGIAVPLQTAERQICQLNILKLITIVHIYKFWFQGLTLLLQRCSSYLSTFYIAAFLISIDCSAEKHILEPLLAICRKRIQRLEHDLTKQNAYFPALGHVQQVLSLFAWIGGFLSGPVLYSCFSFIDVCLQKMHLSICQSYVHLHVLEGISRSIDIGLVTYVV